jgi:hypothetical protein
MAICRDDLKYVRQLREAGVLQDGDGFRLESPNGIIAVLCSDCDQREDIIKELEGVAEAGVGRNRVHPFMNNGGAILLSPRPPIYERHSPDEFLLEQIHDIMPEKEMGTIALVVHAPCAGAAKEDLSVVEIIDHMFRGKKRLKEIYPAVAEKKLHGRVVSKAKPGVKVACFIQVDYGDKKRMYFVSREAFGEWYQEFEVDELDRLDHEMETQDKLNLKEARNALQSQKDDEDIEDEKILDPDYTGDKAVTRLVRDMRISGQHTVAKARDITA